MLQDKYQRVHSYLRISLTDKCNLRCFYCMPKEDHPFLPSSFLMNAKEVFEISKTFVNLGVKKIRLTGGEPLIRADFKEIIHNLSQLPIELSLTTNGIRLDQYLEEIIKARIYSINISLDTLRKDRFHRITQRDQFDRVKWNIDSLLAKGFPIKINMVVMKGINDDEILDFINWTEFHSVNIRFIEFMPFFENNWTKEKVITLQDILFSIGKEFKIEKLVDLPNDTSKNYKIKGFKGSFGIISTMTAPFCESCNRIRLTADGKIKNCLFSSEEMDLLQLFRQGQDLAPIIQNSILKKAEKLGGQFSGSLENLNPDQIKNRSMIDIGG